MLPDDPRFTQPFSIVETEDAAFDYEAGNKVMSAPRMDLIVPQRALLSAW